MFQDLLAQLHSLVSGLDPWQQLLALVPVGAIPFIESYLGSFLGAALGIHPALAIPAAVLGNLLATFGAIALSAEFIWLAFLLAMLVWHLLPTNLALPIDVGVAVAAVGAFAWHQGEVQAGAVIGPAVGIASAVVMTEIYHRLRTQSEERRRLLDELVRTQAALAERERAAGRLAEREHLAREIHDTVGQSLSSVILLLRASLADTAMADSPAGAGAAETGPATSADVAGDPGGGSDGAQQAHRTHRVQLQTALDSKLAALGETRRLVRGLAPEPIGGHGLRTALVNGGLSGQDALVLLIWAVGSMVVAARTFRWE